MIHGTVGHDSIFIVDARHPILLLYLRKKATAPADEIGANTLRILATAKNCLNR
jgi:hypothetical protein